jgi:hypothetical protein
MIRLVFIAVLLAGIAAASMWLYSRGGDNARTDQLERTLQDADTFNEGDGTGPDCSGLDRMLARCGSAN